MKVSSPRFELNKTDGLAILKVLGWTVATAVILALIDLNSAVQFPKEFLYLQPLLNTGLVTVYKMLKDNK